MAAITLIFDDEEMLEFITKKGWVEIETYTEETYQNVVISIFKEIKYKKGNTTLPLKDAFSLEFSERILKLL